MSIQLQLWLQVDARAQHSIRPDHYRVLEATKKIIWESETANFKAECQGRRGNRNQQREPPNWPSESEYNTR